MKTREHLLGEANGNKIHISSHYYSSGLTLGLSHSIMLSSASSLWSFLNGNIGGVWCDQENFCLGNQRSSFLVEFSNMNKLVRIVFSKYENYMPDFWISSVHHSIFPLLWMCATFLLSFSHEQLSYQRCHPTLLLFIHPSALGHSCMDSHQNPVSGTTTAVSPMEQLPWVCVCTFSPQLSDRKQGWCCSLLSL